MVRLTADLISKCPQYFNAVRERELDLRGNKIAVIENLGATEDQFDSIDISDNEIVKLENFPYLKRLTTLLINNNRIARINPNVGEFLPKLHTLVLTNNRLVNLVDLDPLASLKNLQTLSLLDNLVTKKPNYRLYTINRLKKLRLLDFRKIKQKERLEAEKFFASKEAEEDAKREPVKTFTPGEVPMVTEAPTEQPAQKAVPPTPEQILAIKAAIANSQTLEEVARLEKALKSGQLPADLKISDDGIKIEPSKTESVDNSMDDQTKLPEFQNQITEKVVEITENTDTDHPIPTAENPTETVGKAMDITNEPVEKNDDTVMEEWTTELQRLRRLFRHTRLVGRSEGQAHMFDTIEMRVSQAADVGRREARLVLGRELIQLVHRLETIDTDFARLLAAGGRPSFPSLEALMEEAAQFRSDPIRGPLHSVEISYRRRYYDFATERHLREDSETAQAALQQQLEFERATLARTHAELESERATLARIRAELEATRTELATRATEFDVAVAMVATSHREYHIAATHLRQRTEQVYALRRQLGSSATPPPSSRRSLWLGLLLLFVLYFVAWRRPFSLGGDDVTLF